MNFKFNHNNLNVRDLEKSIQFYKDALGLTVVREKDAADGSFKLVYLGDGSSVHHHHPCLYLGFLLVLRQSYRFQVESFVW